MISGRIIRTRKSYQYGPNAIPIWIISIRNPLRFGTEAKRNYKALQQRQTNQEKASSAQRCAISAVNGRGLMRSLTDAFARNQSLIIQC